MAKQSMPLFRFDHPAPGSQATVTISAALFQLGKNHTGIFLPPSLRIAADLSFRFFQIVPQSRRTEDGPSYAIKKPQLAKFCQMGGCQVGHTRATGPIFFFHVVSSPDDY